MSNKFRTRAPHILRGRMAYDIPDSVMVQLLTGTYTLATYDSQCLRLDPGGSTRIVQLPAEADWPRGAKLTVLNDADAAGEDLTIMPMVGSAYVPIATNPTATDTLVIADPSNTYNITLEFLASGSTVASDTNIGVLLGSTAEDTLQNVVNAINGDVASATGILKSDASAATRNNSTMPVRAYKVGTRLVVRYAGGVGGKPVSGAGILLSTNPTTGNTLVIGADTYQFRAAGANVTDDSYIGVPIGGTAAATLLSLIAAINGTATSSGIYKTDGVTASLYKGTEHVYAASYSSSYLWIWTAASEGGAAATTRPSIALSDTLTAAVNWSVSDVNVGPAILLTDTLTTALNWSPTTLIANETLHTLSRGEMIELSCVGQSGRYGDIWLKAFATGDSVGTVTTDHVEEATSGHGVDVDGLLIKDEGIDMSGTTVATGDFDITLKTNLADALSITESAGDIAVFDTQTGARKVDWTEIRQTYTNAFTSANDVLHIAATMNHATAQVEGLDLAITQITTNRTSGNVIGILDTLVGKAGDSGGNYYGMSLVATDSGGSGNFVGFLFDAGWDAIMDVSACDTGEADFILKSNVASAMAWRVGSTDVLAIVTTTGSVGLNLDGVLDEDYAFTTAQTLADMAYTQTLATGSSVGLNVHATQLTNKRTAGSLVGVKVDMVGVAADDSAANCVYDCLSLTAAKTGGTSSMTGLRFGAGFDSVLDVSAASTGEADVVMAANLASGFAFRVSTVDLMTLVTTTNAWEVTLGSALDVDYAVRAAGALAAFDATVTHATDTISAVSATTVHSTNRTGAAITNAYSATLDSDAADDSTVFYNAFAAATDGTDGYHSVLSVGAGFDALADLSACASGEADLIVKANVASALAVEVGAHGAVTPMTTWLTTTNAWALTQASMIDQDYTLAAAGTLTDMALTNNAATGVSTGLYVHVTQAVGKRTADSLTGLVVDVTGIAADDSAANCVYRGMNLNANKAGGTSLMTGITFDAGWDAVLDVSACSTGEADVVLGNALADAFTFRIGATPILSFATSASAWEATLTGSLDVDYTLAAAGSLVAADVTVGHATDTISAIYAATVHSTNRTGTAETNAFRAVLDSDAADDSTVCYVAFKAETDGTDGDHSALKLGTGFDFSLDLTAISTGEGAIQLRDNIAAALTVKQGAATNYLVVATTDNSESMSFGNIVTNPDYAFLGAGYLEGTAMVKGLGTRRVLEDDFVRAPFLAATLAGAPATNVLSTINLNWELSGTNAADANATLYAGGGVRLITDVNDNDQMVVSPHTAAKQSNWNINWDPTDEPHFRANLRIMDTADVRQACGLKLLPATLDTGTDADQIYFGSSTTDHAFGANDNWWVVCSIGGADTQTDSGVALAAGNIRFAIEIASDRSARCYINGALVHTTAPLTAGTALLPFVAVQAESAAAAADIVVQKIVCSKLYSD